jgi:GNAT superfamily N-acetyltransferase
MSEPELQIRRAERADAAAVRVLFSEHLAALGYAPDPELDRDMTAFWEHYASGAFLVAAQRGEVIGMGGILDGELRRIFVRSSHRGRGVGQRIITALIEQRRGPLRAIVARENLAARRMFLSAGFAATGRAPSDPKASHCEILEMSHAHR